MNLPNWITISRFFLIPLYFVVFFSDHVYHTQLAFLIVLFAGFTDMLDGYLARKYDQTSQIGAMLDPLADKLMMITVVASFLISQMISWWAAVFFLFRDVSMIIGSAIYHFRGKKTVPANTYGKLTTILYYLAFFLIMFKVPYGEYFLWGVILFSFITSLIYVAAFRNINRMIV